MKNQIYGLIGHPVKHSLSPVMHNSAFKKLGINGEYRLFELPPENLKDFLLKDIKIKDTTNHTFNASQVVGFNVTIPHKVCAKKILEDEFPINKNSSFNKESLYYVTASGAINTVKRSKERIEYYNTDAPGFLRSLKEDLEFSELKGKNILVIGCGGAGRAIISALSWQEHAVNKIFVYDISQEQIESVRKHFMQFDHIKQRLEFIAEEKLEETVKKCQLLINASSAGMKEGDSPIIEKSLLHSDLSLYDVVYNRETQLIKDGRSLGLRVSTGLGMLLFQGVIAFEIWTGQEAPVDIMRNALVKEIGGI